MPEKRAFDPRIHLIDQQGETESAADDGGAFTKDDEALARILQEEIMEEERRRGDFQRTGSGASHSQPTSAPPSGGMNDEDMQLLMTLQQQELDALRGNQPVDDLEFARRMQHQEAMDQMHSDYQSQLDYARRIQERALMSNAYFQNQGYSGVDGNHGYDTGIDEFASNYDGHGAFSDRRSSESIHSLDHDPDLELARRMQELEQLGMGRLNSDRALHISDSSHQNQDKPMSSQEEEDARIARMMMETGTSFRHLDIEPRISSPLCGTQQNIQEGPDSVPEPPADTPPPFDQIVITTTSEGQIQPAKDRSGRKSRSPRPQKSRFAPLRDEALSVPENSVAPGQDSDTNKDKKKTFGLFRQNKTKGDRQDTAYTSPNPSKPSIPAPIPPRPERMDGPLPYSSLGSRDVDVPVADKPAQQKNKVLALARKNQAICSNCQKPASSFLIALDKKYHTECFTCVGCYQAIDSTGPFAYMTDESGDKHPLHRKCYAELYGVKCAVCKHSIPAGPDGKVSFVKHPFFDTEQMCPRHAQNPGRRCTGCHRFEPEGEPFPELNDSGRCVCFSCCRSVVVDSDEAQPLWDIVVEFFEKKLQLPIWKDMRKVPILVVGYEALNDQMMAVGATHGGSSQIMTRGLCLTEHQSGRRFKLANLKFNKNSNSFEAVDVEARGYTFFQVPDANKVNPDASVTAILCLSGLPKDLTASVLAHEATHAWIKLHPRYDISYPIPPQVEEGVAQLVAMLFLTEGLSPASTETYGDKGPSDEKLRQYFKFSIETDDHEIYGEGYRRAAEAYANIGIEALLSHIVLYQEFPRI